MNPTGRLAAAREHLELLRADHERQRVQDRYYVRLAYIYGIPVEEIALTSGLPSPAVRHLLTT